MVFHQMFDCTDSVLETLQEEGRDTAGVSDEEIREMVLNQFEDHDFNKRAQMSMKVSVSREPAPETAQRVLQTIFDNTESFEHANIGSELAYVVKAILDSRPDKPVVSAWDLSGPPEENHQVICDLFRECFDEEDVVWRYIEISGDKEGDNR